MSIYGIGNSGINRPQLPLRDTTGDVRQPGQKPAAGVANTTPLAPQQPATAAGRAGAGVPVEPPPGTDPALWSILSGEERAFFAKAGNMGPLTYGRAFTDMKTAQMPANRGGRLDVKI
ncbi:MAG TPA: hypothetical protein VN706_25785 [Gemmatimonadaceae bacterium]|nr:hypothetical protein [Gemmatimonadaceae bacterium]